jgi:hypothetical protein
MVDLTDRLKAIKELVDAGKYFTINRARQYGKTTTLTALKEYLENDYIVVDLSFECTDPNIICCSSRILRVKFSVRIQNVVLSGILYGCFVTIQMFQFIG